jgi:hypothetical protein
VSIAAHPARECAARALAARIGTEITNIVYDPDPDGRPNALRTAALAWNRCTPGSSHHLVLQDDVLPVAGLLAAVGQAIRSFPHDVLAFYAHGTTWNGAAGRLAVLSGRSWVRVMPDEYFPSQAAVMPCEAAHEFAKLARQRLAAGETQDDELMCRFFASRGYRPLLRVPNLVEHMDLPSLVGNNHQGIRRSVCFQSDLPFEAGDAVLGDDSVLPLFRQRHFLLRVKPGSSTRWHSLTRSSQLALLHLSETGLRSMYRSALGTLTCRPERGASAARFVRELSLGSYGMGWVVGGLRGADLAGPHSTLLLSLVLHSYIEAGFAMPGTAALWSEYVPELLEVAQWAFGLGFESRRAGRASDDA